MGTLHRTVFQADGSSLDIVLKDYKYVPELHVNLFSITKSLSQGWRLSNDDVMIVLKKDNASLKFDKVYQTDNGKVVGVELLPSSGRKGDGYAFPTTETDTDVVPDTVASADGIIPSNLSRDINRMH
jgi:hypothetical protein